MLLATLVHISQAVSATPSRLQEIALLADYLRCLPPAEVEIGVHYLMGELPQGKVGLGLSLVRATSGEPPAPRPSLHLQQVATFFERIRTTEGPGSQAKCRQTLAELFRHATGDEQRFLMRLVLGELRQGALEGVMLEAVAAAADRPAAEVRRAVMLTGALAPVAVAALTEGARSLRRFRLQVLRPVKPMLAQSAEDAAAALDALGPAALEYKLDGARVQIHKVEQEVRVFTRRLNDVTARVPELVAAGHEGIMAKSLDARYEAGARGGRWLKIKPTHTLDLVVLAAEWGSGRRRGWLSNLHLGARDSDTGGFIMLGKTFKGLTDELLTWQTKALLAREIGREKHIVHVRPKLVVEVAFNDLQVSHQYPAQLALRFARVKRYRDDKPAAEADTMDAVRAIYQQQSAPQ